MHVESGRNFMQTQSFQRTPTHYLDISYMYQTSKLYTSSCTLHVSHWYVDIRRQPAGPLCSVRVTYFQQSVTNSKRFPKEFNLCRQPQNLFKWIECIDLVTKVYPPAFWDSQILINFSSSRGLLSLFGLFLLVLLAWEKADPSNAATTAVDGDTGTIEETVECTTAALAIIVWLMVRWKWRRGWAYM